MDSSHRHRAELLVSMQLRRCALDQNPLRRRVDRIEAVLLMLTALGGLLVIPAALALGVVVHEQVEPSKSLVAGIAAGLSLPALVWPALLLAFRLGCRPLDRLRAEAWAREWRRVSPRWTRRWS